MIRTTTKLPFIGVLVFTDGGWRTVESRFFPATHPEIAYQLAMASGSLKDYGRQFLGLADLYVQDKPERLGSTMEKGDAESLVVRKDELSIFHDSRWRDVPHDPAEMEDAFREPPVTTDLPGLDDVQWDQLSHAYGPAKDVARDLKRLASSDPVACAEALGWLHATILHQGSVYDATVRALPFIIRIASNPSTTNRKDVIEFLWYAADSTNIEEIRRYRFHRCDDESNDFDDLSQTIAAREELMRHLPVYQSWQADPDPDIKAASCRLIDELTEEQQAERPCPECHQPLRTPTAKQCFKCGADWH